MTDPAQDRPALEYYLIVVQKPVADGWETVYTTHSRYGISPVDAAQNVLSYEWPVEQIKHLGEPWSPERDRRNREARAGISDYRLVVEPASHNRRQDSATVTVGELLLARITTSIEEQSTAKIKLRDALEAQREAQLAVRDARSRVDGSEYGIERAAAAARHGGVDPDEVDRVARKRPKRRPRK